MSPLIKLEQSTILSALSPAVIYSLWSFFPSTNLGLNISLCYFCWVHEGIQQFIRQNVFEWKVAQKREEGELKFFI